MTVQTACFETSTTGEGHDKDDTRCLTYQQRQEQAYRSGFGWIIGEFSAFVPVYFR